MVVFRNKVYLSQGCKAIPRRQATINPRQPRYSFQPCRRSYLLSKPLGYYFLQNGKFSQVINFQRAPKSDILKLTDYYVFKSHEHVARHSTYMSVVKVMSMSHYLTVICR